MNTDLFLFHSENRNVFIAQNQTIQLDMTKEEYDEAIDPFASSNDKNRRIVVHEYTHWLQSVGTPFGYYWILAAHFENDLLKQIEEKITLRLFQDNKEKVRPPLSQYITNPFFYWIWDDSLFHLFKHWLDFFYFSELFTNRRDYYYDIVKQNSNLLLQILQFTNIQEVEQYFYVPWLLSRVNRFIENKTSIHTNNIPTSISYDEKYIFSGRNREAELVARLNSISAEITYRSLLESYATVVEYIDSPNDFEIPYALYASTRKPVVNEYYDPLKFLQRYLFLNDYEEKLFLETCLCIFDVVFAAPVLPQCKQLRQGTSSMFDLDIISRFFAVVQAAHYIPKLNCFTSRAGYTDALCRYWKWHTPDDIYSQIYRNLGSLNIIPEEITLNQFINMRISGEFLPLNRDRFVGEIRIENINPCILKLKDQTKTNATFLYGLTFEAENELWWTCAMSKLDVVYPSPLKSEYIFYQKKLFQKLVDNIWEKGDDVVYLYVPQNFENICSLESDLKKWIDQNHIDVQVKIQHEGS